MQAEALVRARPEGEVATGAPRRIEPARIVEHAGIVVGGDIVHHQPVALGDGARAGVDVPKFPLVCAVFLEPESLPVDRVRQQVERGGVVQAIQVLTKATGERPGDVRHLGATEDGGVLSHPSSLSSPDGS